jgi:mycofactocin system glycosyltransferase
MLLIGGAPLRLMRLSATGAEMVAAWLDGAPIGDSTATRKLARRLLDAGIVHPSNAHWGQSPVCVRDVTVVVPVKDDHDGLERLLDALTDVPVVVVDDGSSLPVTVRGASVIRRDQAGGPGVARNEGLAAVETEFVAFLDADVEPGPDFIDGLVGHFDDPAVVAVAPRVRSRPGSSTLDRYEADLSPLDLGAAPANVGPRRPVSYVPTAALIARTATLRDSGGFDADLRYGEDVDLVWRLADAGGTIRYDPNVEVTHDSRPSPSAWLRQRIAYGSSAPALGQRHGAAVAPARCSPWSAVAWLLVALRRPFLGASVAAASTAALVRKFEHLPSGNREAFRLAGRGHLHAGRGLAQATGRVWWPIALPLAMVWPRVRPAVVVTLLAGPVIDWRASERHLDPVRSIALRVVDQMAYGLGVWRSSIESRSIIALRPELVERTTVPGP